MGIIGIIFTIIGNLPQIIGLIKSILDLIHKLKPSDRAQALNDLQVAYQVAHKTGDTDALKKLHDSLCSGVGCPSGLKAD